VGFAGHWRRWLLTDVLVGEWQRPTATHFVHHYLRIVKHLGGSDEPATPRIVLTTEELQSVDSLLGDAAQAPAVCALAPGAEYGPAKRWLPGRFVEVAKHANCRWVILGGPNDAAVCKPIADGIGLKAINLAGKTTLRQLCAVLARCRVLLTNDSGAMHIGYAVRTRVVAIFGSTEPAATGPQGEGHAVLRHKVECSPCFLRECPIDFRCMKRLEASEVVRAVTERL
jgi:heptosyltransferase-2